MKRRYLKLFGLISMAIMLSACGIKKPETDLSNEPVLDEDKPEPDEMPEKPENFMGRMLF